MRSTDMAAVHSDEFKRDAVRIAQTGGLTSRQVARGLRKVGRITYASDRNRTGAGPNDDQDDALSQALWFFTHRYKDKFHNPAYRKRSRDFIPHRFIEPRRVQE